MPEGDVVDVDEHLVAALAVPDLVAGITLLEFQVIDGPVALPMQ
jgi:hypothetical protein